MKSNVCSSIIAEHTSLPTAAAAAAAAAAVRLLAEAVIELCMLSDESNSNMI